MLKQYILAFLISMVPLIELRGGVPAAITMGIPALNAIAVCAIGNMLPVPIIYLFARKILVWGSDKAHIGKVFTKILDKGEKAGQRLVATASRKGLFVALLLFVGIPLPGTGAWTGTLAASLLNMGWKSATAAVALGVLLAGCIMAAGSTGLLHLFGY
ncbi:MAG: small multidrug export protein [Ruminococcaceae bacterium]|nr:small multidrug export protein [Oscillospiraceae bacterium]